MSDVKRAVREGMEYWDKICSVKHYGFIHSPDNSRVLKVEGIGSWIDMYEAQNVVDAAQHEINDLKAENESLRADAERYRWLRDQCYYSHVQVMESDGSMPYVYGEELDNSVDFMISAISSPENPS
jgi:hypothetical protein